VHSADLFLCHNRACTYLNLLVDQTFSRYTYIKGVLTGPGIEILGDGSRCAPPLKAAKSMMNFYRQNLTYTLSPSPHLKLPYLFFIQFVIERF
jgi:hypothetical protein